MNFALLTLPLLLIIFAFQTTASAAGKITVNGELVDPDLFDDAAHGWENCDAYTEIMIKSNVIDMVLTAQEGEKQNVVFSQHFKNLLAKQEKLVEDSINESRHHEALLVKLYVLDTKHRGSADQLMVPISEAQVTAEYNRLRKAESPLITNIVEIKYAEMKFDTNGKAEQAQEMLSAGKSFDEVGELLDDSYGFVNSLKDRWKPVNRIGWVVDVTQETKKGDVLGPSDKQLFFTTYYFIEDIKRTPFLELENKLPGSTETVFERIHKNLVQASIDELLVSLRAKAVVFEDGNRLEMPIENVTCQ